MSFWERFFGNNQPEEVILSATDSIPVRASKMLRRAGLVNKVNYVKALEIFTYTLMEYRTLDQQNAYNIVDSGIAKAAEEVVSKTKVKERASKASDKTIALVKKEPKVRQTKVQAAELAKEEVMQEPIKRETKTNKQPKPRKTKAKVTAN